ncbi:alpha/beta fold hydrolase [Leptospira ryugenii]|nr:alpha/beta fold hydrolase [Leptospira ryugenii]
MDSLDLLVYFVLFLYFPGLYLFYYLKEISEYPSLHYQSNPWNDVWIPSLARLHRVYRPFFFAYNRHLMIFAYLWKERFSRRIAFQEEILQMKDGGTVGLSWYGLENAEAFPETPIVVVLHTITGDAEDLRLTVSRIRERLNATVVVCIRRGHGNLPLTKPSINTMGSTLDLQEQIKHIRNKFPKAPLLGLGISAGSGLLARYLGESGKKCAFSAAMAISPAYDIEKAFPRVHPTYSRLMALRLRQYFLKRHETILKDKYGFGILDSAKTIHEFQDNLYHIADHPDRNSYYRDHNPIHVIGEVDVPLLILNAEDDPVCVKENVEENLHWFDRLPKTILVKLKRGSHIAFLEGLSAKSWSDELICDYFERMLELFDERF